MGSDSIRSEASYKRLETQFSEKQWVVHIKTCLEDARARGIVRPPSIFMASSPLRSLKHEDFVPQVVAIGPYHSDLGPHHSSFPENQETERYKAIAAKEMEKHKVMASKFLERTLKKNDFCSLANEFLEYINQIREEYDTELVSCQVDEKLAYMLALDSTFVVEVLRSNAGLKCGFHDYYCSRFPRPLRKSILQDFVLLENQIPLFLLLKVMALDKGCGSIASAEESLAPLIQKVAHEVLPFSLLSNESVHSVIGRLSERKHLLDCLYRIATHGGASASSSPNSRSSAEQLVEKPTHFPRAVELFNSGITFKGIEPANIIGVKYDAKKAILYVPKIRVGDDTERLFRNLTAYESHLIDEVHVLSYLRFMNSLVDGPDDVALLLEKGVLAQDIGSNEEVASMWNRLCINTMRVCSVEYEHVAQQLLRHCQYRPNALKAEFKRTYLSRPWLVVSVLSAASLLVMTLLITIYTVELYNKDEG
ncbi:hypothetical protein GOP47_0005615 [Adiantum capillus-veneris]|uniref:Uncharacterized protein n=1 Tax=Adiantum capillus-veneris TaxID=13818 RepID=A0A9D4V6D3_ADICA|nr:hypothetical protein GOP47_0005615 [Adiantum capillus-veneris]